MGEDWRFSDTVNSLDFPESNHRKYKGKPMLRVFSLELISVASSKQQIIQFHFHFQTSMILQMSFYKYAFLLSETISQNFQQIEVQLNNKWLIPSYLYCDKKVLTILVLILGQKPFLKND